MLSHNVSSSELVFENAEVMIFNTSGVRVNTQVISGSHSTIDIENLPSGLYMMKIVQHELVYLNKFIKN